MTFLALQPQPARGNLYGELCAAINSEFEASVRLLRLLAEHLPPDALEEARSLLDNLQTETAAQAGAFEREIAWRTWLMAQFYFQATGKHIDDLSATKYAGATRNQNIVDIRDLLRKRK